MTKTLRELAQALKAKGIEIEHVTTRGSGHFWLKVCDQEGRKANITSACSPSDRRSMMNKVALAKRVLACQAVPA